MKIYLRKRKRIIKADLDFPLIDCKVYFMTLSNKFSF